MGCIAVARLLSRNPYVICVHSNHSIYNWLTIWWLGYPSSCKEVSQKCGVPNDRSFTISAYDRWISSRWKPYARSARLSSVICFSAEHKTCKHYIPTSHWWVCLVAFTYPNQTNTHLSSFIPYSWWLNQVHFPWFQPPMLRFSRNAFCAKRSSPWSSWRDFCSHMWDLQATIGLQTMIWGYPPWLRKPPYNYS